METSKEGLNLIKNFEGCHLKAYKCPAGVWTIGYGHTKNVKEETTVTKLQAEELLKQDLKIYENHVKNIVKTELNQNQFDALVSFCYNCGAQNLKTLVSKRTLKEIADAILKYNKANGKILLGLEKRRKAERDLFLKPQKLPYKVITTTDLTIRKGAGKNHEKIRVAKKGEILTVWAVETKDNTKWAKNGNEFFSLDYCKEI